jgi:uncharacterized protein
MVFNHLTYPNLTALFSHLQVTTCLSDMSFSVSRHGGVFEYAGSDLAGLFAQPTNALRPRFWSMLRDIVRFYRVAPRDIAGCADAQLTLGEYLACKAYGRPFCEDHLMPMAAAIWSAPAAVLRDMPAAIFIRFFENHGLLRLRDRPAWRTVVGGSKEYVVTLARQFAGRVFTGSKIVVVERGAAGVMVHDAHGRAARFDHVVIAAHSDQALAMLQDASAEERRLLGAIRYTPNKAVLHTDSRLMPRRRNAWSSWNYIEPANSSPRGLSVTYWMNRLQGFASREPIFVTLNPPSAPDPAQVLYETVYDHPIFDPPAIAAQGELWSLQGQRNTWFCSAYFGAGFHEDGLQAGLAVAEDLGGVQRPWTVENESGRIVRGAQSTWRCAS